VGILTRTRSQATPESRRAAVFAAARFLESQARSSLVERRLLDGAGGDYGALQMLAVERAARFGRLAFGEIHDTSAEHRLLVDMAGRQDQRRLASAHGQAGERLGGSLLGGRCIGEGANLDAPAAVPRTRCPGVIGDCGLGPPD